MNHDATLLSIEEPGMTLQDGLSLFELLSLTGHGSCGRTHTADLRQVRVRGLAHDSRRVRAGDLFVVLEPLGGSTEAPVEACSQASIEHAREAVAAGAVAIVSGGAPLDLGVPWLRVTDPRRSMAEFAAEVAGRPSEDLQVVGITGTNGKTSVAHALARLLEAGGGRRSGVIGTVHAAWADVVRPSARTTPESPDLQSLLAQMREDGCDAVALEVSSHGLDLHRVHATRFAAVALTNISRDHLDWHGDMESYVLAKSRLFKELAPHAPAVICVDDEAGKTLAAELREETPDRAVLTVGFSAEAELRIESFQVGATGSSFLLSAGPQAGLASGVDIAVHAPWVGRHNAENIAVAAGLALCLGLDPAALKRGLASLELVPGRLVPVVVDDREGVRIFVDYAHTPSALSRVLDALRELTSGRLHCVFGCGGDRDEGKREEMGAVVGKAADVAFATSDNPRSEDPEAILRRIVAGMEGTSARRIVESDRRRAIELCLAECEAGDVVVVAGKGHETHQDIDGQRLPFDDAEVVRAVWARLHPVAGQDSQ